MVPRHVFTTGSGLGVELRGSAIHQILAACRRAKRVETGGILIGCYGPTLATALVAEALGPPRDSRHASSWFERGVAGMNEALEACWRRRPRRYYLGEWHFHPMASAAPSEIDLRQMRDISRDADYRCPEALLVILGGDPAGRWTLSATIVCRSGAIQWLRRSD